jgi:hypothetical protein
MKKANPVHAIQLNCVVMRSHDKTCPCDTQPPRLRAALRIAIDLRFKKGMTIGAACEEAGISPQGYHKAMKRPAVRDYLQTVQMEFVASVEGEKAIYKARALKVIMDLMLNSKSEAVRARMVEFFASDGCLTSALMGPNSGI